MAHIVISGPSCVRVSPPLREHQQLMMHTGAPLPPLPSPLPAYVSKQIGSQVLNRLPPDHTATLPPVRFDMRSDAACSESAMFWMSRGLAAGWCIGGTEVARERFSRACAFKRSNPFRVNPNADSPGVPELTGGSLVALRCHRDQLSRFTRPGPWPAVPQCAQSALHMHTGPRY